MLLPILAILSALPPMTLHKSCSPGALLSPSRKAAYVFSVSDRPWSEQNPAQRKSSYPPPPDNDPRKYLTTDDPNRFRSMVDVSFQPGELHKTIAVPVFAPMGTRLFVQDASLKPGLSKEQHASVVIGYPLKFDGNDYALVGLYADHEHPIIVEVTRDRSEGAGKVTLTIDGDFVKVPVR